MTSAKRLANGNYEYKGWTIIRESRTSWKSGALDKYPTTGFHAARKVDGRYQDSASGTKKWVMAFIDRRVEPFEC